MCRLQYIGIYLECRDGEFDHLGVKKANKRLEKGDFDQCEVAASTQFVERVLFAKQ